MEQLCSVLAKNVDSQKFKSLAVKKKFQAAISVAGDLAARNLAIIGYTDFIRYVGVRKLFLRFPNEGNLRNCIDPVWITRGIRLDLYAKRARRGDSPLLHGD